MHLTWTGRHRTKDQLLNPSTTGYTVSLCLAPVTIRRLIRFAALVVHLGTMFGGHYIAYCLVDPEKMFGDRPLEIDLEREKGRDIRDCKPEPIAGAQKDRRVWCFCSE